jgi:hypothetical protein
VLSNKSKKSPYGTKWFAGNGLVECLSNLISWRGPQRSHSWLLAADFAREDLLSVDRSNCLWDTPHHRTVQGQRSAREQYSCWWRVVKNELLLQICIDILGLPIELTASKQASAHGNAILGAVATGIYGSVVDAITVKATKPSRVVEPNKTNFEPYSRLYQEYKRMVDTFN